MPTGMVARSTDTVMVDGAFPVLGVILSQLRLLLAVQASVLPPLLVMFSSWLGGSSDRKTYKRKLRLVGLTLIPGATSEVGVVALLAPRSPDAAVGASAPQPASSVAVMIAARASAGDRMGTFSA